MEGLIFILDLALIAASIWSLLIIRGIGGIIGKSYKYFAIATVIFGVDYVVETIIRDVLHIETDKVEFIHRLIALVGLLFLVAAFRVVRKIGK